LIMIFNYCLPAKFFVNAFVNVNVLPSTLHVATKTSVVQPWVKVRVGGIYIVMRVSFVEV